jgi:hypothetical protein
MKNLAILLVSFHSLSKPAGYLLRFLFKVIGIVSGEPPTFKFFHSFVNFDSLSFNTPPRIRPTSKSHMKAARTYSARSLILVQHSSRSQVHSWKSISKLASVPNVSLVAAFLFKKPW